MHINLYCMVVRIIQLIGHGKKSRVITLLCYLFSFADVRYLNIGHTADTTYVYHELLLVLRNIETSRDV